MESFYLSQIDGVYVIALSIFIGIEVIKNVPAVLHTPLMSGANAISGIIVIGGIIQLLTTPLSNIPATIIASLAVVIGIINVSGGFFVTHRMLAMFSKPKKK
ncbi:MAG: NAD(P) transhydrogenase subunit alpha [Bacteroidetes bacterium]|nr:MAG: NAD(P) transhydrogenase subunit alpha [Bacteroidota bacterium]MBL1145128.1 NAD(P) transhydrogenase subunit alpha [Bacteroidota bacterium]MCB0803571.1 NAD(P) transhydrogenase subunit alpha [Flavobacteriales bacterium]NOG57925.1 NAD(P) transhydrogenase subunit alpha [Bacteroidota bacterium]